MSSAWEGGTAWGLPGGGGGSAEVVPAACVEATASVAVGAGPTAATYATEVYDNDGMVDLGTNNDRITVQTTGKYEVRGSVEFDTNTTGDRAIVINHKNSGGSVVQAAVFAMKPTAYNNGLLGSWTFDASAGDYFTIDVYQSRGTNTDIGRRQLAATRVAS